MSDSPTMKGRESLHSFLDRWRERLAIWLAPWIVYDDVKEHHRGL